MLFFPSRILSYALSSAWCASITLLCFAWIARWLLLFHALLAVVRKTHKDKNSCHVRATAHFFPVYHVDRAARALPNELSSYIPPVSQRCCWNHDHSSTISMTILSTCWQNFRLWETSHFVDHMDNDYHAPYHNFMIIPLWHAHRFIHISIYHQLVASLSSIIMGQWG